MPPPNSRSTYNKRIGNLRTSQIVTTYGPGSLLDLPKHSVIVAGLDTWSPKGGDAKEELRIVEPRLAEKISHLTGIQNPGLYAPPPDTGPSWFTGQANSGHIGTRLFPQWFVVQSPEDTGPKRRSARRTARRLVHSTELEGGRFEKKPVVATRFVRACTKGHVDDLNWRQFVHLGPTTCRRPLLLVERGQTGDLSDLEVRCKCGARRSLSDALRWMEGTLGRCRGKRPWLGKHSAVECDEKSRLLIRTASNAYFGQVHRVLSIPESDTAIKNDVEQHWNVLQAVFSEKELSVFKGIPDVANLLNKHGESRLLEAIEANRAVPGPAAPAKLVELEAFLNAPEGYGNDTSVDPDYHARRLSDARWRHEGSVLANGIGSVVQVHRLREVSALVGFTRLEAGLPDINGEYDSDVSRADLAEDPKWFPAVENRGEGIFVSLEPSAIAEWMARPAVKNRVESLKAGHTEWAKRLKKENAEFPGGDYVLLHTTAHLLMQSLVLRCGYPATAIRERIYLDRSIKGYGFLLYTASPDADGTLGGLVQQANDFEDHLAVALQAGELCSSDPICAQHSPTNSLDERWLHGAACHSCCLIPETSCEMRNEFLDRALVVPTVDETESAFFGLPA